MYFEITRNPNSVLPISDCIGSSTWLHRAYQQDFYGYQLGKHGGNFVNFDLSKSKLVVDFSFYKDFVLTQDLPNGILLSNINSQLPTVFNGVVTADLTDAEVKFANYDLRHIFSNKASISLEQAASIVKNILVENLKKIATERELLISYSGGLDSGTLAWLSYYENIPFTAVVENRFKQVWNLPFDHCYLDLLSSPPAPAYHWDTPIAAHFYHPESSGIVGGFYGDIALLHHRDLYYQSCHLTTTNLDLHEHYDRAPKSQFPQFQNRYSMLGGIVKLHMIPQFRQWFENFEILDAYRDPRLVETVLQLDIDDLLIQFKTAYIQKYIINNMSNTCWKFLCDYKNDYSKF